MRAEFVAPLLVVMAMGTGRGEERRAVSLMASDVLSPLPSGAVAIEGWLGERLQACIDQRVMPQDVDRILGPYRSRTEENGGHWRCEYWGKWCSSATLAARYQPTPQHMEVLARGVRGLLATQTADGYIGTYRDGKHLEAWDVWGRKYVLLGLLADHALRGDATSLAAACRHADFLIQEAPPDRVSLADNGLNVVAGLPPSSILEPFAVLFQRTGEQRYLDFAQGIIANWSKPGKYNPNGLRLIEHAVAGTLPSRISARKAYEMMSCFEGVCEMYRITRKRRYLTAAIAFADLVRNNELMVHGSASNQELWCDGRTLQTETLEQPAETCVTTTWMKLCHQLLRLTGDSKWADELELSLFNALISAMTPDGRWWAYFSPLSGQRVPSLYQHADMQLSCCVANGPRGLLLTPEWAVMQSKTGFSVNLYSPGAFSGTLADGTGVKISQATDYPATDVITLTITPERPCSFQLALRIPRWSEKTTLAVGGTAIATTPGTYAIIDREWIPGDTVELQLDLRGRAVSAPSGAPQLAVMRGPVLLALDDRFVDKRDVAVRLITDQDGRVDLRRVSPTPESVWLAFEVPFVVRPSHYFNHQEIKIVMCDYASAGSGWSSENLFRTWLPQPLYLRTAFPAETWRLTCPDVKGNAFPTVPQKTSTIAPGS